MMHHADDFKDNLASKMTQLGFTETAPDHSILINLTLAVLNSETASMIVLEYNMNPIVATVPVVDIDPEYAITWKILILLDLFQKTCLNTHLDLPLSQSWATLITAKRHSWTR